MLLNLMVPLISFGIVSFIGILITPFYINSFGFHGLGIISNSNAMLQSLFFIGGAFTTVYARLYAKTDQENEKKFLLVELNKLLTFVFLLSMSVSIILLTYSFAYQSETLTYYSIAFAAASVIIKSQSFTLIPFAQNKLYINALIDSLRTLLRNALFLILFIFVCKNISTNAVAMILSAIIVMFVLIRIYPENNIFALGMIKYNANVKNSIWVCINQGGAYLFSFADIFLINFLLGNYVGGRYALLIQIPVLMKSIASVAQGAISSFIVKLPAIQSHDSDHLNKVMNKVFIFYAFFISSAFILLIEYKDLLFYLWLDKQYNPKTTMHFDLICYMFMVLTIISIINIFLAAWGYFEIPAKATMFFSVASVSIVLLDFFFFRIQNFLHVFTIIYGTLVIKNICCYFYFFIMAQGNANNAFLNLFYMVCAAIPSLLLIKINKFLIGSELYSLTSSVLVILIASLPLLNMFKKLNHN
ncbi:hypothetical protein M1D83_06625 [Enterobacteriaceae bacterium]